MTYYSHAKVIVVIVQVSGLFKGKSTIIARHPANSSNKHLAQGWMHVEEECPIDVPRAHLAKVSFIPTHPCRL